MDASPTLARRRVLAAGTATLFAGLAGCNGGDRTIDPGPPPAQAPANAGVLVSADMSLLDHDGTDRVLDAYGAGAGGDGSEGGPGGPGGGIDANLIGEFEGRTGLAAADADVIVIFADQPQGAFAAYVIEGEWSESTVLDSIESATGREYEPRDHEGGTVYEPTGGGEAADYLGFVAEGRYAVGSEGAVEAAIETTRADRASVGDPLLGAFEDATDSQAEGTTYVTAATDDPRGYLPSDDSDRVPSAASLDTYEKATVGTVAYTAAENDVAIDARLHANDGTDAGEIADFTVFLKQALQGRVKDAVAAELRNVAVERDGDAVTITYRSDVEGAATLAGFL
jgi:hypothetical protein